MCLIKKRNLIVFLYRKRKTSVFFKIKAINPKTAQYYDGIVWTDDCIDYNGNPVNYRWEVLASEGKVPQVYIVYANGSHSYTGGATHVPVVEFTAPADGTYTFSGYVAHEKVTDGYEATTLKILVASEAIQSQGFTDGATAALDAGFGANTNPWA